MLRDPLHVQKLLAVTAGVPEYDRLIAYGRVILYEMSDLQQAVNGLPFCPKKLRDARQEEFIQRWNDMSEKLEAIQKRMKELEDEEKKKTAEPVIVLQEGDKK